MRLDPGKIARDTIRIPETENLTSRINQNGVFPGEVKLAQFCTALALRGAPSLYAQDGKGDQAIAHVKLFDPCGAAAFWLLEWDQGDEAFCWGYTTCPEDVEYSYVSLRELAFVEGRLGVGIEIDTCFLPTPIRTIKEKLVRPPSGTG